MFIEYAREFVQHLQKSRQPLNHETQAGPCSLRQLVRWLLRQNWYGCGQGPPITRQDCSAVSSAGSSCRARDLAQRILSGLPISRVVIVRLTIVRRPGALPRSPKDV